MSVGFRRKVVCVDIELGETVGKLLVSAQRWEASSNEEKDELIVREVGVCIVDVVNVSFVMLGSL